MFELPFREKRAGRILYLAASSKEGECEGKGERKGGREGVKKSSRI